MWYARVCRFSQEVHLYFSLLCNITAIAGFDYFYTSAAQTFTSGSGNGTIRCVTISLINDNVFDGEQTFTVSLTTPDPNVLITNAETIITIQEDDDGNDRI